MHVHGKKQARKIREGDQARSVKGQATRAKLAFYPICLRTGSIQPKPQALL
jgi:hypothetical protein